MTRTRTQRLAAWLFSAELVYLLVPWQAVFYGAFDFELNQDVVIWMGAPLAWLSARAAFGHPRSAHVAGLLAAWWLWPLVALVLHHDPHAFGPRNTLLLALIGWLPPLNTALLGLARLRDVSPQPVETPGPPPTADFPPRDA